MNPYQVSAFLCHIADKIQASKKPSKILVADDIKKTISAMATSMDEAHDDSYDLVYININVPQGMNTNEAIQRAKALFPCKTGEFELEQYDQGWIVGNMQCEAGYYENNPDGAEYGPDEKGVTVNWETP